MDYKSIKDRKPRFFAFGVDADVDGIIKPVLELRAVIHPNGNTSVELDPAMRPHLSNQEAASLVELFAARLAAAILSAR